MDTLKKRIQEDGRILPGKVIKVDGFLNHQLDIALIQEMGEEFHRLFKSVPVDKILTIEASGIAIAAITAQSFKVPVVFAKKSESKILDQDTYICTVHSYTKNRSYPVHVAKTFLLENENILIIDDFLAKGQAVLGLVDIVRQAKANVVGIGIVIEKGFQDGGRLIREQNLNLHSLAIIDSIEDGVLRFREPSLPDTKGSSL
ncbi:MAG: xanthine phosphoribosyltransferase [Erysipelotrichaceae bacterium]